MKSSVGRAAHNHLYLLRESTSGDGTRRAENFDA